MQPVSYRLQKCRLFLLPDISSLSHNTQSHSHSTLPRHSVTDSDTGRRANSVPWPVTSDGRVMTWSRDSQHLYLRSNYFHLRVFEFIQAFKVNTMKTIQLRKKAVTESSLLLTLLSSDLLPPPNTLPVSNHPLPTLGPHDPMQSLSVASWPSSLSLPPPGCPVGGELPPAAVLPCHDGKSRPPDMCQGAAPHSQRMHKDDIRPDTPLCRNIWRSVTPHV